MKTLLCTLVLSLSAVFVCAQEDRRNVLQSDISGNYRKAVANGYYTELNRIYGLSKGYHGMVDLGYSVGCGDYGFNRFEISTTHGYQFNPYLYAGVGLGFHFMPEYFADGDRYLPLEHRDKYVDIPIFADARITILENNITPFVDLKAGCYVTHGGGAYVNASVGCRIAVWGRQAVNVSLGYAYENLEFDTFKGFATSSPMSEVRYYRNYATSSVSVKVGYEF